jgi:hypothetical protein
MDRYLENGGAGLWCEVEKAVEADDDGEPELVELRNMLPVHAVQSRVRRIVARYTRLMSHYGTTHWKHDWIPESDVWLKDGDFDQLPGHQRHTACSACEHNVRIGRDNHCLNIPCHDARRSLHELSQQRERGRACEMATEAARRRLFEDEPPAGTERLIIADVPGQQPGARVAVFDHEDGSATVEAMVDDLTKDQVVAVCQKFYGDEYNYSADYNGTFPTNVTWKAEVPAHQVERQAQRERRDALFGSADRVYVVPVAIGKRYSDRVQARVAIFDREDGSVEARAMKHDVANARMFQQMCWDLTLKREMYGFRPGDAAEDGDTWVCTMASRQARVPEPAPVVTVPPQCAGTVPPRTAGTVPPRTAGTVTPAAATPSPEPAAPPAGEPVPELQAELLATKSTWLRDPKYLTGEYLDGLFEIAQDVAGALTAEQASAVMENIDSALAHVQDITGKLITLAVAVEEAAPEGTFADSGDAAEGAAQAA